MDLNCTLLHEGAILCNGTKYVVEEGPLDWHDKWFWIYLGIYVGLVGVAGIMSGLTMGLLSLDLTSLKVLASGGKKEERKYAKRIMPLIEKHHLLLVTLLLANAAAVESMPIFLDRITNPIVAISVSVTAVLIFGEVVPQAICTRYGLAIGATLAPMVYMLMVLLFIIAWPISKVLDCLLGSEHGTFFRRAELGALVDLHRESTSENEEPLTEDEVLIIKGALKMRNKEVKDAYVPLDRVYMVDIQQRMDQDAMKQIVSKGHSRVPVYDPQADTVRGLLLIKTLIELNPHHPLPMEQIFLQYGRPLPIVPCNMPLYDLLNDMQTGRCHMAAVSREADLNGIDVEVDGQRKVADKRDILGIITLEDILEQLLQEEILDETDVFVDVRTAAKFARSHLKRSTSVLGVRQYNKPDDSATFSGLKASQDPRHGTPPTSINADIEDARTSDTEPLLQL